jgi:hypothetical protein
VSSFRIRPSASPDLAERLSATCGRPSRDTGVTSAPSSRPPCSPAHPIRPAPPDPSARRVSRRCMITGAGANHSEGSRPGSLHGNRADDHRPSLVAGGSRLGARQQGAWSMDSPTDAITCTRMKVPVAGSHRGGERIFRVLSRLEIDRHAARSGLVTRTHRGAIATKVLHSVGTSSPSLEEAACGQWGGRKPQIGINVDLSGRSLYASPLPIGLMRYSR